MGETPGRGRGTLFWVSRGYVWTSQGQKQGWKVGSGALLRKGLLMDFRQSSFLPPEEERKRKKKEKTSPLIQFSSGYQDLWTCPNTVKSCLFRWWISQTSPSPAPASTDAQMHVCHLWAPRCPLLLRTCWISQKISTRVHTFYYHTYNAGCSLLLFAIHPSSFPGQLKRDWQWIYLR